MADSMCGPSSALQNFQKHSTIDRTLQQDRLISRQTPSQGFRSSGLNASHLDHEFESFQAGQLPLDHGFQQNIFQPAPPGMQQPGPANWAADFQRMNISSSAPQLQQQPYGMHAQQRLDTGGWHQDFARQQNQMADSSRNIQIPSHTNAPYNYSPMPVMGMMNQFSKITPQSELSISQQKQPAEAFDDEAFARAFEEAAQTEMESMQDPTQESTQNSTQNIEMGQDILLDESAEVLMASDDLQMTSDELLNQERIGADTIHDPFNQNEVKPEHQDPEELARTAAKLLDSVQHDQSVKFQNSQFLSLMRQFRDREKTVDGDNIVTKNGMGGYQNQEMNGERYQEQIEILCDALKRMIDSNSPFQRTPANVRKLIHVFFNINAIMNDLFFRAHSKPEDQSRDSYTNLHQIYNRLSPSMQGFLKKYWGAGIPYTEAWAGHILYCTEEDPDILGKFGVDPTPPPAHIQERNVQEFKMKQARPEHSNLPVFDVDAREETFLETYISELLTADTNTPEDAIKQQNALLKVLPYKIPADQRGDVWMECHLQRAREILGSYAQVQAICSWYNIWTRDLPVSDILGFMDILDKTGLASDEVVAEGNRLGRKMTRKTIARIEAKIARGEELTIQEKHFVNGGELDNDISNFQLHAGLLMQEAVAQGATKEEIEDVREKYRKFLAEAREVENAEFEEKIQERKRTGELAIPSTQFILDTRRPESEWKAQDDLVQMRSAAVVGDKICNGSGLTELEQAVWERFQRREQEKKAAELSTTILQPAEEESRSD